MGHFVIIGVGEGLTKRLQLPALGERYAQKMGPATLGASIMGFFICTSGYSCLTPGEESDILDSSWVQNGGFIAHWEVLYFYRLTY